VITEAIRREFEANRLAALLSPTLPATAALKDQEEFDYDGVLEPVTHSYVRTTAPFNLSGLPALSVPCGFDSTGLPVGLQIAGRPFDEAMVLRIGAAYEASTDWWRRKPPIHIDSRAA
jgi:aspartyl-tRNA(Asn)/glutamyl-tRNA(Gln) amidotransferase subunit A